ncbi:citrate synthase/methylcitrate synthase [Candidatus Acetothermia bacterium]|nr:citrate synthase/methylcitrate synthase [Candidatus Acetothermia bacterium]MBI3642996.1 citrate synthase/methylcitrate synthase [Candidatus Acetothermia bacterium]
MPTASGLENVIAAETRLSMVDGTAGKLVICGYPLEEIAPNATYEEALYLLWNGRLPNAKELKDFEAELEAESSMPDSTLLVLKLAAKAKVPTMDALRMAVSTLSVVDPKPADESIESNRQRAVLLAAKFPIIVGSYWQLKNGKEPIKPKAKLSRAAQFLYLFSGGETPSPEFVRALNTYLVTVSDHGMNASTFTARVITSTLSDMFSAVTGAIGALKGPAHGGAPGPALDMVFEIGKPERAEEVIRRMLTHGDRLMGFGHRVYKVRDPRADVLSAAAEKLYEKAADRDLYDLAKYVEKVALRLLEEYKPGRHLQTNVEYFTAMVLHGIGLPSELFSPTFAIGRVSGWTAHVLEQQENNRLIRPQSEYVGPRNLKWVPVEKRA